MVKKKINMLLVLMVLGVLHAHGFALPDLKGSKVIAGDDSTANKIAKKPPVNIKNDQYRADSIKKAIATTRNSSVTSFMDALIKRKEQVGKLLGLSNYYFPVYERVLKDYGLPEELKFLSVIESALNPHAVSRVGATGPWQFMAPTAKAYGLKIDREVDERKDPVQASKAAAAYLKDAFDQFGDWLLAIASYNAGKGAVSRAIAKAGGKADFWAISPYLPAETRNYVPKFLATAYVMSNYRQYDINPLAPNFSTFTDVIDVVKPVSLAAVAQVTGIDLKQLLTLNPAYKKLLISGSKEAPKPLVLPVTDYSYYPALYQMLNSNTTASVIHTAKTVEPSTFTFHTVKKGENLSSIAKKFPRVSVEQIKAWNKLRSSSLQVGMRLKIRKS